MRPLLATLLALVCATPVAAQDAGDAALARVTAHIDAAHFDSARASLSAWQNSSAASALPAQRAAADVLHARLELDGTAAREAWLSAALAHPFSADAGLALLRVGQAAVLQNDTATALVYLNRLIDDFPGSGHRAEAHLWIARAHVLARRSAEACASARAGLGVASTAEVTGLLRIQEERACAAAAARPEPPVAVRPPAGGRFAVQSGAFRARTGADALMTRLRGAGLEPRLVRVPANDLMRVRVGAFGAQAEAVTLRDELRADGFDAVVVGDANQEIAVP